MKLRFPESLTMKSMKLMKIETEAQGKEMIETAASLSTFFHLSYPSCSSWVKSIFQYTLRPNLIAFGADLFYRFDPFSLTSFLRRDEELQDAEAALEAWTLATKKKDGNRVLE